MAKRAPAIPDDVVEASEPKPKGLRVEKLYTASLRFTLPNGRVIDCTVGGSGLATALRDRDELHAALAATLK